MLLFFFLRVNVFFQYSIRGAESRGTYYTVVKLRRMRIGQRDVKVAKKQHTPKCLRPCGVMTGMLLEWKENKI